MGTSTGGLDGDPVSRVGDSPVPGCGFYADNGLGTVAFSGDGEHIARKILAARAIHALSTTGPEEAVALAIRHIAEIGGDGGGIALTPDGRFGWTHNSRDFAVAYVSSGEPEGRVFMRKDDERS